jgi:hypothetical protein
MLIFKYLNNRRRDESFWTEWQLKYLYNFIFFLTLCMHVPSEFVDVSR